MTKKKKGIIIAVVAVILAVAVGCGLYFGLGLGSSETADVEVAEGELYRTKTESFWAGVGKAYISFQHKEEPENKAADDTELYGDVFYVMVSSGEGYDPWLSGNYNLDEENGKLMMTAQWDTSAENYTALADAQPGEEKIYLAENGEYKIPVELPSAKVTFILNPATDKVGDSTPAGEEEEEKKSDDTSTAEQENTGSLFARLTAEDSLFNGDVKGYAQIDMAKDGTWTMKVKVEPYVPDYTQAVNGKWVENSDGSVTLTVTGGDYKDSLANTFTFKKGSDGTYTGSVQFTADKANGIVFNFNFKSVDISKDTTAASSSKSTAKSSSKASSTPTVSKGEMYRTPVYHGIYSGVVGDAYISFMGDGTFGVYVDAGDGYTPWISGKWSLSSDNTKLTLTQKGSGDAGLTGAKADTPKTYTAKNGVFTIDAYFPSGGTATFTFKPSRDKVSGASVSLVSTGESNNGGSSQSNTGKPSKPSSSTPSTSSGDIVLTANDSIYDGAVTCDAVLNVKKDGTWNMTTTVYGNTIDNAVTGTWKENSDKSLTLTVKTKVDGADLASPFKLTYNSASQKYSGTVKLTCNGQFEFNLKFESGKVDEGQQTVAVSGVTLDKQSIELAVNKTYTLTAAVTPGNASNKAVNWSSTDDSIATVSNGKVTAKSAGTAYIIVSTKDGGFTASCRVTVTEPTAQEEYYTASSNDKCNGFPMSLIFENGSFHLNVDTTYFDASDWFKGTYSFNADKSELTLNADFNANGPHLEAAEVSSADTVTYTAENGKFTIVVKDPTASAVNGTFTLTVGSADPEPTPEPEPEPEPTPEANLQLELVASDTIDVYGTPYTADAKLDLYDDNTFKMLVNAGAGDTEAASGTWALDAAYNMVLTVENQTVENSLPETITLNVDYTTYQYSGTVDYVASAYTTFTFNFAPAAEPEPEPEPTPEPTVQLTLNATDTIDVYGTPYTANAKLDLYDDNTFIMSVDAGQGYVEAASGTWALDAAYNMVLTVENQTVENSLPETITLNVDYTTYQYSGTVDYVASAYTTFTFNFAPAAEPEPEPEPTPEPTVQLTLNATDTIDVYGTPYTANAKLDLYDDNTFIMSVDAGQGYVEAASGTWEFDTATYNMVLTVENQTVENSLPETITLNVDYTTYQYSGTVDYVASAYTTFTFNFA